MDNLLIDTDAPEYGPNRAEAEAAVRVLLRWIDEDPEREGLRDTPARFVRAFFDLTSGLHDDPLAYLSSADFDGDGYDELILVKDVPFHSLCEHHLLPFTGTATIGYLPGARVVGLSKLPRMFHSFARRPQIQERLTTQTATAIMDVLEPQGAGVIVRAHHSCMSLRGACTQGTMVTSSLLGKFRENPQLRAEFLALAGAT